MHVVAELCQNHNGSIDDLLKMASVAHKSGATIAKIQALYSDELAFRTEFENDSPSKFGMYRPYKKELIRLKNLDLSESDEKIFVQHCHTIGIIPMITVFTNNGLRRAVNAGFSHFKIASYDSTNIELIDKCIKIAKKVFISTGATTISEVYSLTKFILENNYSSKISILHCKTEYPNKIDSVNMERLRWLKTFGFITGFSDHSEAFSINGDKLANRNLAAKVAINFGAQIIEKHFTIMGPSETKDGRISATFEDIEEIVSFSQLSSEKQGEFLSQHYTEVQKIIGSKDYEPSTEEWWNRRYYQGRVTSSKS
jgi:sialic acid synthase SpsE